MNDKFRYQEILEIEGPPRAYFEILERSNGAFIRITYIPFGIISASKGAVEAAGEAALERIRTYLRSFGGGIVWWRVHPEINRYGEDWYWYCRLQTSPVLEGEVLETLPVKPEGSEPTARV